MRGDQTHWSAVYTWLLSNLYVIEVTSHANHHSTHVVRSDPSLLHTQPADWYPRVLCAQQRMAQKTCNPQDRKLLGIVYFSTYSIIHIQDKSHYTHSGQITTVNHVSF